MIFVPGTSANPAKAAFPVSPDVAVKITISFFTLFFLADVTSKSLGSNTPVNVVRATFDGLVNMKDAESVAKLRGVSVQHLAE